MQLTVILPTRNESENILPLQNEFLKHFGEHLPFLLYVDDSDDETPDVIEASSYPHKLLIKREKGNRNGLLGAIVHGMSFVSTPYVGVMDADGQHPVSVLLQMFTVVEEGTEYVSGTRYMKGGSNAGLNGIHRKLGSEFLRYVPILGLGLPVTDPLTNFCVFDYSKIDVSLMNNIVRHGMMRVQPLLLTFNEFASVSEVPFKFGERNAGKSKMSSKAVKILFQEILWLARCKSQNAKVLRPAFN